MPSSSRRMRHHRTPHNEGAFSISPSRTHTDAAAGISPPLLAATQTQSHHQQYSNGRSPSKGTQVGHGNHTHQAGIPRSFSRGPADPTSTGPSPRGDFFDVPDGLSVGVGQGVYQSHVGDATTSMRSGLPGQYNPTWQQQQQPMGNARDWVAPSSSSVPQLIASGAPSFNGYPPMLRSGNGVHASVLPSMQSVGIAAVQRPGDGMQTNYPNSARAEGRSSIPDGIARHNAALQAEVARLRDVLDVKNLLVEQKEEELRAMQDRAPENVGHRQPQQQPGQQAEGGRGVWPIEGKAWEALTGLLWDKSSSPSPQGGLPPMENRAQHPSVSGGPLWNQQGAHSGGAEHGSGLFLAAPMQQQQPSHSDGWGATFRGEDKQIGRMNTAGASSQQAAIIKELSDALRQEQCRVQDAGGEIARLQHALEMGRQRSADMAAEHARELQQVETKYMKQVDLLVKRLASTREERNQQERVINSLAAELDRLEKRELSLWRSQYRQGQAAPSAKHPGFGDTRHPYNAYPRGGSQNRALALGGGLEAFDGYTGSTTLQLRSLHRGYRLLPTGKCSVLVALQRLPSGFAGLQIIDSSTGEVSSDIVVDAVVTSAAPGLDAQLEREVIASGGGPTPSKLHNSKPNNSAALAEQSSSPFSITIRLSTRSSGIVVLEAVRESAAKQCLALLRTFWRWSHSSPDNPATVTSLALPSTEVAFQAMGAFILGWGDQPSDMEPTSALAAGQLATAAETRGTIPNEVAALHADKSQYFTPPRVNQKLPQLRSAAADYSQINNNNGESGGTTTAATFSPSPHQQNIRMRELAGSLGYDAAILEQKNAAAQHFGRMSDAASYPQGRLQLPARPPRLLTDPSMSPSYPLSASANVYRHRSPLPAKRSHSLSGQHHPVQQLYSHQSNKHQRPNGPYPPLRSTKGSGRNNNNNNAQPRLRDRRLSSVAECPHKLLPHGPASDAAAMLTHPVRITGRAQSRQRSNNRHHHSHSQSRVHAVSDFGSIFDRLQRKVAAAATTSFPGPTRYTALRGSSEDNVLSSMSSSASASSISSSRSSYSHSIGAYNLPISKNSKSSREVDSFHRRRQLRANHRKFRGDRKRSQGDSGGHRIPSSRRRRSKRRLKTSGSTSRENSQLHRVVGDTDTSRGSSCIRTAGGSMAELSSLSRTALSSTVPQQKQRERSHRRTKRGTTTQRHSRRHRRTSSPLSSSSFQSRASSSPSSTSTTLRRPIANSKRRQDRSLRRRERDTIQSTHGRKSRGRFGQVALQNERLPSDRRRDGAKCDDLASHENQSLLERSQRQKGNRSLVDELQQQRSSWPAPLIETSTGSGWSDDLPLYHSSIEGDLVSRPSIREKSSGKRIYGYRDGRTATQHTGVTATAATVVVVRPLSTTKENDNASPSLTRDEGEEEAGGGGSSRGDSNSLEEGPKLALVDLPEDTSVPQKPLEELQRQLLSAELLGGDESDISSSTSSSSSPSPCSAGIAARGNDSKDGACPLLELWPQPKSAVAPSVSTQLMTPCQPQHQQLDENPSLETRASRSGDRRHVSGILGSPLQQMQEAADRANHLEAFLESHVAVGDVSTPKTYIAPPEEEAAVDGMSSQGLDGNEHQMNTELDKSQVAKQRPASGLPTSLLSRKDQNLDVKLVEANEVHFVASTPNAKIKSSSREIPTAAAAATESITDSGSCRVTGPIAAVIAGNSQRSAVCVVDITSPSLPPSLPDVFSPSNSTLCPSSPPLPSTMHKGAAGRHFGISSEPLHGDVNVDGVQERHLLHKGDALSPGTSGASDINRKVCAMAKVSSENQAHVCDTSEDEPHSMSSRSSSSSHGESIDPKEAALEQMLTSFAVLSQQLSEGAEEVVKTSS